jgi:serine/threonine protein kinase/Tol biopolymer transport system component
VCHNFIDARRPKHYLVYSALTCFWGYFFYSDFSWHLFALNFALYRKEQSEWRYAMGEVSMDIKSIFADALEKESPEERTAYLDATCGKDTDLRRKVEALLVAYQKSDDVYDEPIIDSGIKLEDFTISEKAGMIIGRYKLLEKIGEGGMAIVYMAEQTEPIHRKVALKIIKLGMDTKSVIARFEAERQALATMDHPNIAKVLDAGATETGRPYFVMELVTGISITEYCDKNNLSTKDRLALFILVCNAVQHAHQKGIIHRDIKPSNVMVAHRDGSPVPKIIDFGIAKAINQRLTEKTFFTRYAHIVGTPAYMSPEQAELSDLNVDTRTDIYSLGVLLYELLTGTQPFSEEQLRKAGYLEMQRIIREEEPTKPSTKLSTLGPILTDIAKQHGSKPDLLRKSIRGDLDWIVMKSLEKDRIRRYETANGLAMDIQRHLEHEPVLARGPSSTYRLHKFLQRHRSQAIIALAIVVVTVILSIWIRDRIQFAKAGPARHSGILARAREFFTKRDFPAALKNLEFIMNSKHVGAEAQLLYANILAECQEPNEAIVRLESLFDERPEIAGAAHALLARIYWEGELDDTDKLEKVKEHQQKAQKLLPETAEGYFLRAMTAATVKETFSNLNKALNIDWAHYESLRLRAYTHHCSRNFASAAEDARCLVMLRPEDPLGYALRADAHRELDRYEEALNGYRKAIEHTSSEDPQLVDLYDRRRETYIQMGRYHEALRDAKKCVFLAKQKEIYEIHVFTTLVSLGQYEEAKAKYSELYASLPEQDTTFWFQCAKYVVETLEAGRPLSLPKADAREVAFLPMLETEKIYRDFKAKGHRLITDGWSASWSPDGTKLAYTKGVIGVSGIAVYDTNSQQTELLFVPGKDPVYSPDGQYIAFVRDRQVLPIGRLATSWEQPINFWEHVQPKGRGELWVMKANGSEPRRLVRGQWLHWSPDSKSIFYHSVSEQMLYSIAVNDTAASPTPVSSWSPWPPTVSPDGKYMAYGEGNLLTIMAMPSRQVVSQWTAPMGMEFRSWAPRGPQLHMPAGDRRIGVTGLWIYDTEQDDVTKLLAASVGRASWSPDMKKLAVSLEEPLYDIWILDTDLLSPGQTSTEYWRERAEFHRRFAAADPCNAESSLFEAVYAQYLADPNGSLPDLKRYADLFFGKPNDYGTPVNLGPIVNSSAYDGQPSISSDGRELFFSSNRSGSLDDRDIWVARRESTNDQWGKPTNLGPPVNSSASENTPCISQDGLTLYFASNRPHGHGDFDLWRARRSTIKGPWGEPANLGPVVNSTKTELHPHISTDNLSLYFSGPGGKGRSEGYGGDDIWVAKRASINDDWNAPVNLGPQINTRFYDAGPFVTSDGLHLFFHSNRSGNTDIWISQRKSTSEAFEKARLASPCLLSPFKDSSVCISADNHTLYFYSERPAGSGRYDLWQASILHWPKDVEVPDGVDQAEKLPKGSEGKEVLPDTNH